MTPSPSDGASRLEQRRAVRANLGKVAHDLDVALPEDPLPGGTSIAALRRGARRAGGDTTGVMTLVQDPDGVLVWRDGVAAARVVGRRARRAAVEPGGDVVTQVRFEKLLPNQVGTFLDKLDLKLTPNQGLRRLDWSQNPPRFVPVDRPQSQRQALLLVHGTFSSGDMYLDSFQAIERDTGLLAWAKQQYDEVLSFDHPTLGVSPVMNALDLARLFHGVQVPVDVVCHSRGGLVVRWWLEGFGGTAWGPRRVVLVGAPLGGTSLASPGRLRSALDFFTNVGHVLETVGEVASAGVPFLAVAVGLMKVATSITGTAAHLPLIDAVVAMIPGLNGQSRVDNSPELTRLRGNDQPLPRYYAVTSDFQPTAVGWKFWKAFVDLDKRLLKGATNLVFTEANDLVVDTASMTELIKDKGISSTLVHDFKTNGRVYHTNYFRQKETAAFLRQCFAEPAAAER